MKILCRTTIALCVFLAIAFLTAGTAAATDTNATDTNPADFNVQCPNSETDPFTIKFTPCSTEIQDEWEWNFGDICRTGGIPFFTHSNSAIAEKTHTYTIAGYYDVTLDVYNQGNWYTVTKTIPVGLGEAEEPIEGPIGNSTE